MTKHIAWGPPYKRIFIVASSMPSVCINRYTHSAMAVYKNGWAKRIPSQEMRRRER